MKGKGKLELTIDQICDTLKITPAELNEKLGSKSIRQSAYNSDTRIAKGEQERISPIWQLVILLADELKDAKDKLQQIEDLPL